MSTVKVESKSNGKYCMVIGLGIKATAYSSSVDHGSGTNFNEFLLMLRDSEKILQLSLFDSISHSYLSAALGYYDPVRVTTFMLFATSYKCDDLPSV